MNEEKPMTNLTEQVSDVDDSVKQDHQKRYGPGFVNLAIPDRGHSPSCIAVDFDSSAELNDFCQSRQDYLLIGLWPQAERLTAVFQQLKDELTREEMQVVANAAEDARKKFREEKAKAAKDAEDVKNQEAQRDEGLRAIGRLCIEKHGPVIDNLPLLSKVREVRKTLADDILKEVKALTGAEGVEKLEKLLQRFIKEGMPQ